MTMAAYPVYPDLQDASVLVTGGGSGIGASLTEGFAAQGAKVAFIDIAKDRWKGLTGKGRGEPFRPRSLLTKANFSPD